MAIDWQTPGWKGAAIRVVQMLDKDGDGSLSETEAPGAAKAFGKNGKPISPEDLQAWMEHTDGDSFERAALLDHLTWSWMDDGPKVEEAEKDSKGWKAATIATGIAAGLLGLLGLILALTGVGAGAAVALFFASSSAICCPIAGAELKDANKKLDALKAEMADHRAALQGELERAAEEEAKKKAPPLAAVTLPTPKKA